MAKQFTAFQPINSRFRHRNRLRPGLLLLSAIVFLLYILILQSRSASPTSFEPWQSDDVCKRLRIPKDLFVLIKTGACEDRRKLYAHLQTDLKCVPSWAIFSDLAEYVYDDHFGDVPVYDTFDHAVDKEHLDNADEFQLYKSLKASGTCSTLSTKDLLADNAVSQALQGSNGNFTNRGWNLDKWKFLPLAEKAYEMRPDAAWYLILETDTTVIWENLVQWLKTFDATQDHYVAMPMAIDTTVFGYGGSGILLSNSAMYKLWNSLQEPDNRAELQQHTRASWAGDEVLGRALRHVGIKLMWSWPQQYMDSPGHVDFGDELYEKRLWCSPAVAFHHMSIEETMEFWEFEQAWFEKNPRGILRHRDIFHGYLLPRIHTVRNDWDNLSIDEVDSDPQPRTIEQCRIACEERNNCVQYALSGGECRVSAIVRLGNARDSVQSGWIEDRVKAFAKRQKACSPHDEAWRHAYYGFDDPVLEPKA